jgi:hypothetical protein
MAGMGVKSDVSGVMAAGAAGGYCLFFVDFDSHKQLYLYNRPLKP